MKILEKTEIFIKKMKKTKPKVIIVMGPTASGKSSFAIELAQKMEQKPYFAKATNDTAEIISADSRQVYRGLEHFSGAVLPEEEQGIRHHLISFLEPTKKFTIFDFQQKTEKLIQKILERGNVPIIAGGSSFYIEPIIYQNILPQVEPNEKLRKELEEKSTEELRKMLEKKDEVRAKNIDQKNKRRIIRALEIIAELGAVPLIEKKLKTEYEFEFYYLNPEKEILDQKIEKNFYNRVGKLLKEAENLKDELSRKEFQQLGLAFKNIYNFWEGKISKEEFIKLGIKEEQKYAKRQKTYLKKFFQNLPKNISVKNI